MLRIIIASILCVSYVTAMTTTHKPHHGHHHSNTTHRPHSNTTREPGEKDSFRFVYEPHTQQMVVVNVHDCYVFSLSDSEKVAVHTDAGIRALELKLLSALSTSAVVTTTKDQLNPHAAHLCGGHATAFYKEASP
ncbi:uncharacterized protein LOC123523592 [Mercenaria mercenaria]|uniref:uncharacterized protein LOC123523592 n=1 Tax=Mercenaria mercenaria TaxID=6596 RepID=UPI001E1D9211|nr:uncharacterized protein LOC123523592 [Mercenaria mercenaria]